MKGNKSKKTLLVLMAIVMVLVFGGQCLAVETNEEVTVTKKVETTSGAITFIVEGLNFESGKSYEYTLSKTEGVPSNAVFKDLSMDYSKKQSEIVVDDKSYYTDDKEKEYLIRQTNTAYLFIKEKNSENYILEKQKLDLKLPFKYATSIKLVESTATRYNGGVKIGEIGQRYILYNFELENTSYVFEKVTDDKIIEKYQTSKSSDDVLDSLKDADIPSNGWKVLDYDNYFGEGNIYKGSMPTNDGLYVLWLKLQKDGNKVVYGAWVYDNLSADYKPNEDEKQEPTEQKPQEQTPSTEQKPQEQTPSTEQQVPIDDGKEDGKDETVTPSKKIPQTGESYVIFAVTGVVVLAGVIGIIRYRKYKGI